MGTYEKLNSIDSYKKLHINKIKSTYEGNIDTDEEFIINDNRCTKKNKGFKKWR